MTDEWIKMKARICELTLCMVTEYRAAAEDGTVTEFLSDWKCHRSIAKTLLKMLRDIPESILPHDSRTQRQIHRHSWALCTTLAMGISIINIHLDMIHSNLD